jgi:branched-subunit amino acid aminotransferase/4-amino-4-deoxychorismate lyase
MELDGLPITPGEVAALGLYNYGHFTSMRVERLSVRGLSLHLERLAHDCQTLFDVELDKGRVRQLIRSAAERHGDDVVVRVTVFDPDFDIGYPAKKATPAVLVSTRAAPAVDALSPLRLRSVSYQRDLPTVKHVGLFATLYQRRAAQLAGLDDILFVNARSIVFEGATWNIGFFNGRQLVWPESEVLPGVTMRLLRDALQSVGIASVVEPVTTTRMFEMQCSFVTNAAVGVRRIASINNAKLASDLNFFEFLQQRYLGIPGEVL